MKKEVEVKIVNYTKYSSKDRRSKVIERANHFPTNLNMSDGPRVCICQSKNVVSWF